MIQRKKTLCYTLTIFISILLSEGPALKAQQSGQQKRILLSCTVRNGTLKKTLPRKVSLSEFQRLHCMPDIQYFEALDSAPVAEYVKLRTTLKWNTQRTFEFKGGVTSGNERFEVAPGVEVVRTYTSSSMTVNIHNKTATAIFIDGFDLKGTEPVNISGLAYVAFPAHSDGMLYRVDALMADPVWPSGKMQIGLLTE